MALRRLQDSDIDLDDFLLEHVAPGLGCIIAFLMFVSPLKAVLQIRANKHLGDLNPLPLVAIIANCAAWLLYGCLISDVYVILANEPGLLLGVFMTISCYGFADLKTRDLMVKAMLFFAAVISGAGIVISLFIEKDRTAAKVAGFTAVFVLLCYYSAPLSTMAEVLRSRSSASLYWPSAVMNTVNGLLWVAYGLAKEDLVIAVPNAIGAIFGVIQLLLIQVFPAKKAPGDSAAAAADQDQYQPLVNDGAA